MRHPQFHTPPFWCWTQWWRRKNSGQKSNCLAPGQWGRSLQKGLADLFLVIGVGFPSPNENHWLTLNCALLYISQQPSYSQRLWKDVWSHWRQTGYTEPSAHNTQLIIVCLFYFTRYQGQAALLTFECVFLFLYTCSFFFNYTPEM